MYYFTDGKIEGKLEATKGNILSNAQVDTERFRLSMAQLALKMRVKICLRETIIVNYLIILRKIGA